MKKTLVVKDWQVSKLLFLSDDRREIVDLCRGKAMSIQDLSVTMGLNPGSIHNHVHKLHDAGLLDIESTRTINGIVEKKYRRTAAFFSLFDVDKEDIPARNRAIAKVASKRAAACLELGDRPSGLFDINARVSRTKLSEIKRLCSQLQKAVLDADGSGELPVSAFLVLGETSPRKRK